MDITLQEVEILHDSIVDLMHICFNCEHCGGEFCMGNTPWKGEDVKFNNTCSSFQMWS